MMSSILKNVKRVMAAEYSRELSAKVHVGASRYAGSKKDEYRTRLLGLL